MSEDQKPSTQVTNLPTGDARAEALFQDLMQFLEGRAIGMPIFTVLGVVELMRATVLRSLEAQQ